MEPRTDQQSGRRSILVVDGDVQIQRLLDLSLRNAGFAVKTVATGVEALAWLGGQRVDLIVSEAQLTGEPSGFELCRQIKQRADGTSIGFVFLSAHTVEIKLRGIEAGADAFLGKPLYVQEVVGHVRSLLQRRERDRLEVLARGDERFIGDLADFSLVDLLQAIEANNKSGVVLLVGASGARGEIYFRDGRVVDAEVGRLSGMDAVCRLFSWEEGRFEIDWKSIRRRDVVALQPGPLVIEALRRLDEWRRLLAAVPPLATIFEVDYHLLAERLAEIPDEVNVILRLFDGQRTFLQVIDDGGLSDLDALAVIGKLNREQIIRDVRARPEVTDAPGVDIEGWITEAAGPFRAPPARPRRELFGASTETSDVASARGAVAGEPLEETGRGPQVEARRERFTDRLIAESAAPVPSAPVAFAAPIASNPPAPPARAPVPAAERTQQGLGAPVPALSTRPGFAAATPPAAPVARVARDVLTDVTPRAPDDAPELAGADGVPQIVLPQSPEPAIMIPVAPTGATPVSGAAVLEQPAVAGEIVARVSVANLAVAPEAPAVTATFGQRTTNLGMGPAVASEDKPSAPPTSAAGEVVGAGPRAGEVRPARKIILDPEIPEDEEPPAGSSRGGKVLGIALGMALAVGATWFAFNKSGPSARHHQASEAAEHEPPAGVAPPASLPGPEAVAANGVRPDADAVAPATGTMVGGAGHAPAAARGVGARRAPTVPHDGTREVLDERSADPKVARALPTEFPQLLAACRQAFTEKRAKDAEIACIAAKDANPESAEACALLGHALFNRKKRREALQWAERAIELDPKHADAYVIIGGVKQAADDGAAAKAAYKKYLELAPNGQFAADLRAIVDAL